MEANVVPVVVAAVITPSRFEGPAGGVKTVANICPLKIFFQVVFGTTTTDVATTSKRMIDRLNNGDLNHILSFVSMIFLEILYRFILMFFRFIFLVIIQKK